LNEIKEEIKIGLPIVLNLVVDYILATSDRFILAYFMGAIAVGLYVPAYTLGALILLVPKAIGTVVPQLMSKSVDNNDFLEAKKIFLHSIKIFMILTIPFIFGIYLIGYDILILLANDEVADNGKYIATIIAISSFFYGFNILMSQANMVDLKTVVIFKANFLAGIFNLISTLVGFYFIHSIYVPAITTVLSFMIATIYFYKTIESKWLDNSMFFLFIKVLIISIFMFIFVNISMIFLTELSIVMSIIIKILLSLIIYFPLLILLKVL
jgi:O-antigen/teichoic acid export membrane protein